MHYYYDVLANFDEVLWEFYEWESSDNLTPIKKIPLIRVSDKDLHNFLMYHVTIDCNYLVPYLNKTTLKNSKDHYTMLLLSSTKNSLIVELNEEGQVIYQSKLLIEDEMNCNELAYSLKESSILYECGEKLLVRQEFRQAYEEKRIVETELKTLKETNNKAKCSYLYYEWFGCVENNFVKMLEELKKELKKPYSMKVHEITSLIKMSYKGQV